MKNSSQHRIFLLVFIFLFLPLFFHAQYLTGLWTGSVSNDSTTIRKDQSFEIALTEYKGKVYGYTRNEFIVNDTLYYIVKRVKGIIEGDVCEVTDEKIIAYNFQGKLDKNVKVVSTFRRNQTDSTWYLDGTWKTKETKKFYSVTGKVNLGEEKDLTASKIFPHLEELNLANDVAFYAERKQDNEVVVKIAKPERIFSSLSVSKDVFTSGAIAVVSVKPGIQRVDAGKAATQTETGKPALPAVAILQKEISGEPEFETPDVQAENPVAVNTNTEEQAKQKSEELVKIKPASKTIVLESILVNAEQKQEKLITVAKPVTSTELKQEKKKAVVTKDAQLQITNPQEQTVAALQTQEKIITEVDVATTSPAPTESKQEKKAAVVAKDVQMQITNPQEKALATSQTQEKTTVAPPGKKTNTATPSEEKKEAIVKDNPKQKNNISNSYAPAEEKMATPIAATKTPISNNAKINGTNPVVMPAGKPEYIAGASATPEVPGEAQNKKPVTQQELSRSSITHNTIEKPKVNLTAADIKPKAVDIGGRKSEFSQAVLFASDSLEIILYDNGEIDGDTVSVYMNGQIIMAHQGLKSSAIKKTIQVPAGTDEFTLVMFAESLGRLPPIRACLLSVMEKMFITFGSVPTFRKVQG
ncbi:MAG: hypothetical protein IPM85_18135 [Chitinophagaceae bacterium]|nr:hypothetical protein [Chitinophagaceae bacterium]